MTAALGNDGDYKEIFHFAGEFSRMRLKSSFGVDAADELNELTPADQIVKISDEAIDGRLFLIANATRTFSSGHRNGAQLPTTSPGRIRLRNIFYGVDTVPNK